MLIADNHAERVSGLVAMAIAECEGDGVAAFAALCDASVVMAFEASVPAPTAQRRMAKTFQTGMHTGEAKGGD